MRRVLLISLLFSARAFGQTTSGSIMGSVRDPQDAVVATARVTVTNAATGVSRALPVNGAGEYTVPFLEPGAYSVAAVAPGFKRTLREGLILHVNDRLVVDVHLELGAVTDSVTVSAASPLLESASISLGEVTEARQILDLPLNGRDAMTLAGLTPGVVPQDPAPGAAVQLGNNVPGINGVGYGMSTVTVDGAANSTPRGTSYMMVYSPNVDSVAEFKVITNSMSAEFGRTNGGTISMVTKSGTNTLHGTAYWFLRNKVLDANDFFSNAQGLALPALQRNQAGGTLGGPVYLPKTYNGRDRTFFFVDYEALREVYGIPASLTVPTALERTGDFSRSLNAAGKPVLMYDPLNTTKSSTGATVRVAFPGNVIPLARQDPVGRKLMAFYPLPINTSLTGNLPVNTPRRNHNDTVNFKLDQYLGAHHIFGRANYQNPFVGEPNEFGNVGNPTTAPLIQRRRSASMQEVYTISPTLIASANFAITYQYGSRKAWSEGFDVTQIGLPAYFRDAQQMRAIPTVSASGYTGVSMGGSNYSTQTVPALEGSLTKLFARHRIKTGAEYRAFYNNQLQNASLAGTFSFNQAFAQGPDPNTASTTAGNALATMLMGLPASGSITNQPATAFRSSYHAAYVQDDFSVSRRLTLFLGARWEVNSPRTERFDRQSVLNFAVPSPISAKVPSLDLKGAMEYRTGNTRRVTDPEWTNAGPRAGLAWRAPGQMVVRMAYGIFYGLSSADATLSSAFADGFSSTTSETTTLNDVDPFTTMANPYPSGIRPPATVGSMKPDLNIGQTTNSALLSLKSGQYQQWNFTLQKSIRDSLLLEAAYVGNKGSHVSVSYLQLNVLTAAELATGTYMQATVPNPFYGVITDPTSSLSKTTVARRQLYFPYPQYTTVSSEAQSLGGLTYHSFQGKVQKRFSRGIGFQAGYTIGKSLTNATGATIPDPNNLRAEKSVAPFDVSQRLVLSGMWALPVGRGKAVGGNWAAPVDLLLGGWQFNGIATFQKGLPLQLTSTGAVRPDRIRHVEQFSGPIQKRLNQYFDTGAFAIAQTFAYGNAPPSEPDVRGPGTNNLDLSLLKSFHLSEKLTAQFRFEGFNVANRVKFSNPGTQAGSNAFGVITAQQNQPRKLQAAVKLIF